MPVFQQSVQVYDFAVDGATDEVVFDIPAGHTLGRVVATDLTWGTDDRFWMRVGTGDSFDSGPTDYIQAGWFEGASSGPADSSLGGLIFGVGVEFGVIQIYNLNTAAPIVTHSYTGEGPNSRAFWHIRKSAAAKDQIQFITGGGNNATSGKITLVTLKRRNTVESLAFDGEASHDITGLMKNNGGLCVWCSFDAGLSSSAGKIVRVSNDDGATFEDAVDYIFFKARPNSADTEVVDRTDFQLSDGQTAAHCFGVITGAPEDEIFTGLTGGGTFNSDRPTSIMGYWGTAEVNDALRLRPDGDVETFTSGIGYWVKYRV